MISWWGENQSILQAALQNKVHLPYSCRAGICSSCSAICKSGKVVMAENDVLTDKDLADGWILTCTWTSCWGGCGDCF